MVDSDWAKEVREILAAVAHADQAGRDLSRWIWDNVVAHDVLPRQLPQPLTAHFDTLEREIRTIRLLADQAFERYSSAPLGKLLKGLPLTREEFYLCRAMGTNFEMGQGIGLLGFDEYDVYRMFCYEDDGWLGYINIYKDPPQPNRAGSVGRSPEECQRRYLRPEQDAFFREFMPQVYERFADD